MMTFEKAQDQRDFSELIPTGTLCLGILHIKPYNATAGITLTPTKAGTGKYLKCDITVMGGKHDKRHVFTNLNVENPNSVATDIAHGAIKAILECSRHSNESGAPVMPAGAYDLGDYADLDGVSIAFKVKIESSVGYNDKNEIAVFLSPFQTVKDWARMVAGDMDPDPNAVIAKKAAAPAPAVSGASAQQGANRWGGNAAAPAEQAMPVAINSGETVTSPIPPEQVGTQTTAPSQVSPNVNAGAVAGPGGEIINPMPASAPAAAPGGGGQFGWLKQANQGQKPPTG